ncbi:MAG: hypothetical protein ACJ8CQ_13745 [Microvirga sp.]
MSAAAFAVWVASAFTSWATIEKPRPASPARAASIRVQGEEIGLRRDPGDEADHVADLVAEPAEIRDRLVRRLGFTDRAARELGGLARARADRRDGLGELAAGRGDGRDGLARLSGRLRGGRGPLLGLNRDRAELVGIAPQRRRRVLQKAHRVADLGLETVDRGADRVRLRDRVGQVPFPLGDEPVEVAGETLRVGAVAPGGLEGGDDRPADEDQHGGLDDDDDRMHRDPLQVARAGIDRVRQDEIERQVVQRHEPGGNDEDAPVAEARQHGEHGEIVEVHLHLPGVAGEGEHEERGLPDERHRERHRDRAHRPLQQAEDRRKEQAGGGGKENRPWIPPETPGDQGEQRHVQEGERKEHPRDRGPEDVEISHGRGSAGEEGGRAGGEHLGIEGKERAGGKDPVDIAAVGGAHDDDRGQHA